MQPDFHFQTYANHFLISDASTIIMCIYVGEGRGLYYEQAVTLWSMERVIWSGDFGAGSGYFGAWSIEGEKYSLNSIVVNPDGYCLSRCITIIQKYKKELRTKRQVDSRQFLLRRKKRATCAKPRAYQSKHRLVAQEKSSPKLQSPSPSLQRPNTQRRH